MPRPGPKPLLPRRIRLELEVQRTSDARRAAELVDGIDETTTTFEVTSGRRVSAAVGRHVMVGGEWMKVTAVRRDTVTVQRGTRATAARFHGPGVKLQFGSPMILDLPVVMYEDDWRVGSSSVVGANSTGGSPR